MQLPVIRLRREMAPDQAVDGRAARYPLHLPAPMFQVLLEQQGPSLGLWRAAEVAALREHGFHRPVLDLGCGDGLVTSLVLRPVEVGVDPDGTALARAARLGIYHRLIARPLETAGLPAEAFATVISNSVLEHVADVDALLAAVARVLRPGGCLIFTAPTEAFSRWLLLPLAGYAARRNRALAHRNLWPVERWAAHLEAAGLEIESTRSYLRSGLVTAWDALEVAQQVRIGGQRALGRVWRRIPPGGFARLAEWGARLDLSAPEPGGGRLIVARKR